MQGRNIILLLLLLLLLLFNCKWAFTWWQWYYNKTTDNTHKHMQTKHSTQTLVGQYTNISRKTHNYSNVTILTAAGIWVMHRQGYRSAVGV
jgi:hypothetical protein